MANRILRVHPLGWLARLGNVLMVPVMYILSGTFREKPQRTHTWDVQRLTKGEAHRLDEELMAFGKAVKGAVDRPRRWSIRFHIPIWRGWRSYVVLHNYCSIEWYVGWVASDEAGEVGISLILLVGPVRMLLGPNDVKFFAIDKDGVQIPIQQVGAGRIGDHGPFREVPLL